MCSNKKKSWVIPFGGNGFITSGDESTSERTRITPCGIATWSSINSTISLYFHSQYPGRVLIALRLSVPEGISTISFSLSHYDEKTKGFKRDDESRELRIQGAEDHLENCGIFIIPVAGYMKMDIRGVTRTGPAFASVTDAVLISEGDSLLEETYLRFVDEPGDFYFGRRGPSVHLGYQLDNQTNTEYFYNEVQVPRGQDVVGAYFCAMGFAGGYFGIQVNSPDERRVLFSIWSEYDSDNPAEIPEDYKVKILRSGDGVYVGEFGNEGSGAQSYLKYMWEPEATYKFIIQAIPIDTETTKYTAWFNPGSSWILIASFEKPKVATFVKGPYSFSENFIPDMGHIERHCLFRNQWACADNGNWSEVRKARFTADATAAKETRMDVSGGVGIDGNLSNFFLRNCGFFSDRINPGTEFTRESSGSLPPVDVSLLP